jgi:hypothetical protein
MRDEPTTHEILNIIFDALHENYDATTDASSNLCIQFNIRPNIIDIHDAANNRHFTVEVLGERFEY